MAIQRVNHAACGMCATWAIEIAEDGDAEDHVEHSNEGALLRSRSKGLEPGGAHCCFECLKQYPWPWKDRSRPQFSYCSSPVLLRIVKSEDAIVAVGNAGQHNQGQIAGRASGAGWLSRLPSRNALVPTEISSIEQSVEFLDESPRGKYVTTSALFARLPGASCNVPGPASLSFCTWPSGKMYSYRSENDPAGGGSCVIRIPLSGNRYVVRRSPLRPRSP